MTNCKNAHLPLRYPLAGSRCCHSGCSKPAQFWIGPKDSNGIDDYTEMCAEHRAGYTGDGDVVVEIVPAGEANP